MPTLRTLWWSLGAALLLAIAALSLLPIRGPDLDVPNSDKLNHAFAYIVLTLYFGQLVGAGWRRRGAVVLGLLAYGIGIEALQALLPSRSAELADVVANLVGIGIGLALLPSAAGRLLLAVERRLDIGRNGRL